MMRNKHIWAWEVGEDRGWFHSAGLQKLGKKHTNTQMLLDKIEELRQNETTHSGAYANLVLNELKQWIEE